MKKNIIWISVAMLVLVAGYLYQTVPTEKYTVSIRGNNGIEMGTIQMSETKAGVLLILDISGLTPEGGHAIHIHETGDCTPLESFKNAGGHFNPTHKSHGMKHPKGYHAGDMPNLHPDEKGHIRAQVLNRKITLEKADGGNNRASVFDPDGSAIVIHAGADDHMSQPSGAAGKRIACGVISR